jgi:hypothetical protein
VAMPKKVTDDAVAATVKAIAEKEVVDAAAAKKDADDAALMKKVPE